MDQNETDGDPPKSISFDNIIMDVCCHPSRELVAVGDIDGEVSIHSYCAAGTSRQLMSFNGHKKSCRRVRFNSDGSQLVTASKDKSVQVFDMAAGSVTAKIKDAHESAIFSLLLVNDNVIATGDDDGSLKVWDLRHRQAVMKIRECDDYISDMVVDQTKKILLATSGEGTLSAFDIRKHKLLLQSELLDSGLLSLAVVKNGAKVVCGSEEGVLDIFNWGEWGNISDRFPGHPMSVDAIIPLNDSVVCTGASDGIIRAVSILPNRIMGTVGEHPGFPIEALSLSHCGQWLASCSHDQLVKFSDIREVLAHEVDGHRRLKRTDQRKVLSSKVAAERDFFGDLDPDQGESSKQAAADKSSSEDDSCDSESESGAQKTDNDDEHVSCGADFGSDATKEARTSDKDSNTQEENGSDVNSDSDSQDSSDDDDD